MTTHESTETFEVLFTWNQSINTGYLQILYGQFVRQSDSARLFTCTDTTDKSRRRQALPRICRFFLKKIVNSDTRTQVPASVTKPNCGDTQNLNSIKLWVAFDGLNTIHYQEGKLLRLNNLNSESVYTWKLSDSRSDDVFIYPTESGYVSIKRCDSLCLRVGYILHISHIGTVKRNLN